MKVNIRKILLVGFIGSLLLAGGAFGAYKVYKSTRQAKLIKQVKTHLANSNSRKALLILQRLLRYNKDDLEACRLMAQLSENSRSPAALLWRNRVVELQPDSMEDRLALAQTALVFRDFASATNALAVASVTAKTNASYHNIAGTVAAALNQPAQAEAHFVEAAKLRPGNELLQLNLAVLRLHSTNNSGHAEARAALQRIGGNVTNSALRCQALRELTVDAMRLKNPNQALLISQQLIQDTNSVFKDRLLRLDILRDSTNAAFKPTLVEYQQEAGKLPATTYELAMWQMSKTSPGEAFAWLRTLPLSTQTNQPTSMLLAECFTLLNDYKGLQAFLEPQNWEELEFIRRAFKTRALRGQDLTSAAKGEWEMTLKVANNQKASLLMLLRLAIAWKWQSEGEELLWAIVNRYPDEKWAFDVLNRLLYVGGRTRPLMMLYNQELKRSPSDLAIKNNLAITALLLEAMELRPHDMAREVYEKSPTNSAFASTYAYSLFRQKKQAEAMKVMASLSPKDLEDPSIAGYYALLLDASGDKGKARSYFSIAEKAPMLPEEKKLFEQAMAAR